MAARSPDRSLCAVLALALLATACNAAPTQPSPAGALPGPARNAEGYLDLTVPQLAAMLPNKDFTFVNVHVPYQGEIEQTDAFIPYDHITEQLDKLPAKDAPIVLYCRSGRMSTEAATELAKLGYTNVMELNGGFNAWQAEGHELLMKR